MKTLALKSNKEYDSIFLTADSFQAPLHSPLFCPTSQQADEKAWALPPSLLVRRANHVGTSSTAGTLTLAPAPAPSTYHSKLVSYPYFLKPFFGQLKNLICFPQKVHYSSNKPFITSWWMCDIMSRHSNQNVVGGSILPLKSDHIMKKGQSLKITSTGRTGARSLGA